MDQNLGHAHGNGHVQENTGALPGIPMTKAQPIKPRFPSLPRFPQPSDPDSDSVVKLPMSPDPYLKKSGKVDLSSPVASCSSTPDSGVRTKATRQSESGSSSSSSSEISKDQLALPGAVSVTYPESPKDIPRSTPKNSPRLPRVSMDDTGSEPPPYNEKEKEFNVSYLTTCHE